MPAFNVPIDIVNRGLQHVGARQISVTAGFTELSKAARETASCYGKLKRAELRANVWRFATRKAPLRAIDTNTMLAAPALWSATTTYFAGSVVSDSANTLWVSRIANNLNNPPTNAPNTVVMSNWAPYFGPMTVALYDSSQTYFAGELVYTAAGDGTNNVYKSLLSGNALHPALPNQWSVSTTYRRNQVVQTWPAWSSLTTYTKGQTVLYTDGNVYSSLTNGNLNNTPSSSATNWALIPVLTLSSQQVPALTSSVITPPTTSPVNEWSQSTGYSIGSVVMFNASEYLSLVNNNTGNFPNAAASTSWIAMTGGTLSMSLIDLNIGNNPANAPAAWSSLTTYATGNTVYNPTDGLIYTSLANSNLNNPPASSPTFWSTAGVLCPWTTVFTLGGGNDQWLQVGGASFPLGVGLTDLNIDWPVGSGPAWQSWNKNVYRLPAGYLRRAPQDPTDAVFSWLGAPSNHFRPDWQFESDFLITTESTPIVFRFVADVADVTLMDDQFCEMLAAKIGQEVCETLTQSSAKVQQCTMAYKTAAFMAKNANAIEIGSEDPSLDDWIAARI